jgi:hypothetical protein
VRLLYPSRRRRRFTELARLEGIGPEKLLLVKSRRVKEFEEVKGKKLPLNLLCEKFMILRFLREESE